MSSSEKECISLVVCFLSLSLQYSSSLLCPLSLFLFFFLFFFLTDFSNLFSVFKSFFFSLLLNDAIYFKSLSNKLFSPPWSCSPSLSNSWLCSAIGSISWPITDFFSVIPCCFFISAINLKGSLKRKLSAWLFPLDPELGIFEKKRGHSLSVFWWPHCLHLKQRIFLTHIPKGWSWHSSPKSLTYFDLGACFCHSNLTWRNKNYIKIIYHNIL